MGCCSSCEGDKNLQKDGQWVPLEKRSCTDCVCTIIFSLFWCGMLLIIGYSFLLGDIIRIIYGYDSYGNVCNMKNDKIEGVDFSGMDMTNKPFVFFMDVLNPEESLEICVSACPNETLLTLSEVKTFAQNSGSELCNYNIDVDNYTTTQQGIIGPCPLTPILDSDPTFNRCVPSIFQIAFADSILDFLTFLNVGEFFDRIIADFYSARFEILGLAFLAFALSVILVFGIRYIASVVVWLILFIVSFGSIAVTGILWWAYYTKKMGLDDVETLIETPPTMSSDLVTLFSERNDSISNVLPLIASIDDISNDVMAFLIYAIVATVFTVILLLVILVMIKRIAFAVELFHQAGKALTRVPLLLLLPLWTFILLLLFFVLWSVVLIFMETAGIATIDEVTGFISYEKPNPIVYMWWYWVIGLIWTAEFILACQEFVIASSVANWYFTRDKNKFSSPICDSICKLVKYHMGSMILGAFIITLIKIPRLILMYIERKLKDKEGAIISFLLKCMACCLWCLENCMKFVNRNAYILIAIEGRNFCISAQRAFATLLENVLRVAAINSIGDFVLFLGKLAVVAAVAIVGILLLQNRSDLHYYAVPVLVICIFAYLISHTFLVVYEMTIDTLLLCFCEDVRVNDGSPGREYFMDKDLMKFVDDSKRVLKNAEKKDSKKDENAVEVDAEEVEPVLKEDKV